MKMMQIMSLVGVSLLCTPCYTAWAENEASGHGQEVVKEQEPSAHNESKWGTAGHEVKEATGAVVDATQDSVGSAWDSLKQGSSELWEKTKSGSKETYDTVGEKSKKAWDATKEETERLWHKGKAALHEATAPEKPAAAPPKDPAEPTQPAQPKS